MAPLVEAEDPSKQIIWFAVLRSRLAILGCLWGAIRVPLGVFWFLWVPFGGISRKVASWPFLFVARRALQLLAEPG